MIFGIGVDLVKLERIELIYKRFDKKFVDKILTDKEKTEVDGKKLALHFAAKEAFVKAIGTGFRGISFKDMEILKDENGKPYYQISNRLKKKFGELRGHLSISHDGDYLIAMAVVEKLCE